MGTAAPHSAQGQPVSKCAYGEPAHMIQAPVGLCARRSAVLFGSNGHTIIQWDLLRCACSLCQGVTIAALHGRHGQHRTTSHLSLSIIRTNIAGRYTTEAESNCRTATLDLRKAKRAAHKKTKKLSATVPKQ